MPKSMQSSRLSAEAQAGFATQQRVGDKSTHWCCQYQRHEWCDRRAWLSDGVGSGSSITKTQSAGRRPCVDKWRNIVVDAQVMVM